MSKRPKPWSDDEQLMEPNGDSRASFGNAFERLVGIMSRLRAPNGCAWDREQTLETLKPYLVEETYEVVEAIDEGDVAHHQEELGDLLLQVVFQSQLRALPHDRTGVQAVGPRDEGGGRLFKDRCEPQL